MSWRLTLLCVAACGFDPPGGGGIDARTTDAGVDDDWLPGYGYRKPITITAGATIAALPVSVLTFTDPDLTLHAPGAADLAFAAADGVTALPYEIVGYTAGSLDAWVLLAVDATAATTIYLYYGGGATPSPASVWAAYAGVWHMSSLDAELDRTAHHNDASAITGRNPAVLPGIIGDARAYDGIDDALGLVDPADDSLDVGTGSFTYQIWVNVSSDVNSYDTPFFKGGSSNVVSGYDIELGTSGWKAELVDTTGSLTTAAFNTAAHGQWLQLGAVIDRGTAMFTSYADGAPEMARGIAALGSLDTASGLQLGRNPNAQYHGLLDEVRVIKAALAPEQIAAEHRNAIQRASFVVIGAEQPRPR